MATRLYLRSTAATSFPTAGSKSVALPTGTANTITFTEASLSTTIGTGQVQSDRTSLAQTTAQSGNFSGRFSSSPLAAQTISGNTWTFFWKSLESNAAANTVLAASIYIWRPSTSSRVGFIYDSTTGIGAEFPTTASAQTTTRTLSGVVVSSGDLLVAEFWYTATQAMATSYTNTFYFNGTNDTTTGTGNTSTASYIETPQNLTFSTGGTPKTSISIIM